MFLSTSSGSISGRVELYYSTACGPRGSRICCGCLVELSQGSGRVDQYNPGTCAGSSWLQRRQTGWLGFACWHVCTDSLMGCATDGTCIQPTHQHINMAAWMSSGLSATFRDIHSERASEAPVSAGSMTHFGLSQTFYKVDARDRARQDSVDLNSYQGWSTAGVSSYLESISSIDRSLLAPCSSGFSNTAANEEYLRVADDDGGLTLSGLPDGGLVAYCSDGYFWLAPLCWALEADGSTLSRVHLIYA